MTSEAGRLARTIFDLERRLSAVERSNQLPRSSVQIAGVAVSVPDALQAGVGAAQTAEDAALKAETARQAAEAAQQGAQDAATAAQDALDAATTAQDSADGKTTIRFATTDPVGDGTAVGDVWFRREAATGTVLAQWEWTGTDWDPRDVGSALIAGLDVGKLTAGTLAVGVEIVVGDEGAEQLRILGGPAGGIFATDTTGAVTFALPVTGSPYYRGTVSGAEIVSTNWTETTGFRLDAMGGATFDNVAARTSINAPTVTTDRLIVGGRTLAGVLADGPRGLVAWGQENTQEVGNITGERGVVELLWNPEQGREYVVSLSGMEVASDGDTTFPEVAVRGVYNTFPLADAGLASNTTATPTISSPRLKVIGQYQGGFPGIGGAPTLVQASWTYALPDGPPRFNVARWLLTVRRSNGAGNVSFNTTGDRAVTWWVIDVGPKQVNSLVINSSSDTSPPPAGPPPRQRYAKAFNITAAVNYFGGNGGQRSTSNGLIYQGQAPGGGGAGVAHALLFLDLQNVRNHLPPAATIIEAQLRIITADTYQSDGRSQVFIGSHGEDTIPATWPGGSPYLFPGRSGPVDAQREATTSVNVTGIITEIKDRQASGLTVGEPPDDRSFWYSKYYPPSSGRGPYVDIVWEV